MRFFRVGMLLVCLVLSACSPPPTGVSSVTPTSSQGALTPYWTPTPTTTPTPRPTATPTFTPTATPTPVTHTVAADETMTSIALKYGISLQALLAANPEVIPDLLRVGTVLLIPTETTAEPSAVSTPTAPAPTALPLTVSAPICHADLEGGAWCFCQVHNDLDTMVESLSLQFELYKPQKNGEAWRIAQAVAVPLNFWQPDTWIPAAAYFSGPLPTGYTASVELLTALAVMEGDSRYLPLRLSGEQVELVDGGKSVEISGEVTLAEGVQAANDVWILGAAYDANGAIVGIRRWESHYSLSPGASLPFSLRIYSMGVPAVRAVVWVEALP